MIIRKASLPGTYLTYITSLNPTHLNHKHFSIILVFTINHTFSLVKTQHRTAPRTYGHKSAASAITTSPRHHPPRQMSPVTPGPALHMHLNQPVHMVITMFTRVKSIQIINPGDGSNLFVLICQTVGKIVSELKMYAESDNPFLTKLLLSPSAIKIIT